VPELSVVGIGVAVDTLVVRLLVGQSVKTWQAQADGLAAALGAHNVTIESGRVEAGRGRDIVLRVRHHDALTAPVRASSKSWGWGCELGFRVPAGVR
jgi:S-DNA-T family DNA segregation ATPase FtsK/SpoIIIE